MRVLNQILHCSSRDYDEAAYPVLLPSRQSLYFSKVPVGGTLLRPYIRRACVCLLKYVILTELY